MNLFQRIVERLQDQLRIVITNSDNFEVKWTVTSSRFRLYSVVLLIMIFSGVLFSILFTFINSSDVAKNDASIERKKLEFQFQKIKQLSKELDLQSVYIKRAKQVISGSIPVDSFSTNIPKNQQDLLSQLDGELTENEKEIERKVQEDFSAIETKQNIKKILHFISPSSGEIRGKFRFKTHPFVEIETAVNEKIFACNSGVVMLSGNTKTDGFFVVLKHQNGFVSIYKNLKTITKRQGAKVKRGEIIGLIMSKSNKQTFPLHFELWYDQFPVNPEEYIKW